MFGFDEHEQQHDGRLRDLMRQVEEALVGANEISCKIAAQVVNEFIPLMGQPNPEPPKMDDETLDLMTEQVLARLRGNVSHIRD